MLSILSLSVDDWFIGSTAMASGIPLQTRNLTVKFHYNDLASVESLFQQHPGDIASVVLEAETTEPPATSSFMNCNDSAKETERF